MKKRKKAKGLKNPAAVAAVAPSILEAGKGAGSAVKQVNRDTGNSLSWLAVGAAGIGVFLIYKIARTAGKGADAVGGIIDSMTPDPNSGGGNVTGKTTDVPYGATISQVQAETISSQLANILGSFGRLNEKEIQQVLSIFSGKTPRDYVMISDAFGLVPRNVVTGEITWAFMGQKLNLTDWLTIEMQPAGIARLRQVMPGVF